MYKHFSSYYLKFKKKLVREKKAVKAIYTQLPVGTKSLLQTCVCICVTQTQSRQFTAYGPACRPGPDKTMFPFGSLLGLLLEERTPAPWWLNW
jgi:hypothetical protein